VTTTGIAAAKLSIADGGLSVLGTITLGDAGLTSQKYIVTPVLSVMDEGLVATGGMSIIDSGLSILASGTADPALEVMDLGVMIPVDNPKTLIGDGLVVTAGGMTVAGWDDLVISGTGTTDLTLSAGIEAPYMIVGGEMGIATGLDIGMGSPAIPIRNGAKFAAGTVNWIDAVTITEELYVLGGMTVHDSMLVEAGYGDGIGSLDLSTVFDNEPEMVVFGDTYIDSGTQTGTQFSYPSDRRLKQDIELLPNAVETLHQLNGVSFRWNQTAMAERSSKPSEPVDATEEELEAQARFGKVVGVIAQDVRKAVPEAVAESKRSDMLAVDYMKLVPVVMEALKEIHARFKAQSADPVYHRDLKKRKLRAALEALMEEYRDTEARNQELGLRLESVERLLVPVPVISTGLQPLGAQ
jgi:hypothetical protein